MHLYVKRDEKVEDLEWIWCKGCFTLKLHDVGLLLVEDTRYLRNNIGREIVDTGFFFDKSYKIKIRGIPYHDGTHFSSKRVVSVFYKLISVP